MAFGQAPEAQLALNRWEQDRAPPHAGGATMIFNVDDAQAAVAELRRRGVSGPPPPQP